jgi:DNA mismatch endonuclease (patch repair protein)
MSRIRAKDTKPELVVRRVAHRLGYRFRLHRQDLPGKPDIVFAGRKSIVLVHGCFWHSHPDPKCRDSALPKSRTHYWQPKLERNKARDAINERALEAMGWRVMVIWECETKDQEEIARRLQEFLGPPGTGSRLRATILES